MCARTIEVYEELLFPQANSAAAHPQQVAVAAAQRLQPHRIGERLGIRATKYTPSAALAHLWR